MDLNKSKIRLKSQEEIDKKLQEFSGREHLYSIALFDILGFSNFVQKNGTDTIMELYTKLLDLINRRASSYDNVGDFEVSVAPVPTSSDWKNNHLAADANGYVQVCHFSDTFLIYVNYEFVKQPWLLADQIKEEFPLLIGEAGTQFSVDFFPTIISIYLFCSYVWIFFVSQLLSGYH